MLVNEEGSSLMTEEEMRKICPCFIVLTLLGQSSLSERSVNLIEVAAVLTGQMRAGVIVEEVDEQAVV